MLEKIPDLDFRDGRTRGEIATELVKLLNWCGDARMDFQDFPQLEEKFGKDVLRSVIDSTIQLLLAFRMVQDGHYLEAADMLAKTACIQMVPVSDAMKPRQDPKQWEGM